MLFLANWLKAAVLMLVLVGSMNVETSDVPLMPSVPAMNRGSGNPAS
jgi:hypothetical protein